jgi:hypothetical protein
MAPLAELFALLEDMKANDLVYTNTYMDRQRNVHTNMNTAPRTNVHMNTQRNMLTRTCGDAHINTHINTHMNTQIDAHPPIHAPMGVCMGIESYAIQQTDLQSVFRDVAGDDA